jgi:uncharacterized damage-inducible protein DinB
MHDDQGRLEPPLSGQPVELVSRFHHFLRDTLFWKCEGLNEEQLRFSPVPSGISLISILKHSINVEQFWIHQCVAGLEQAYDWTDEDPDAEWKVGPTETYADLKERYLAVAEVSRAILAETGWHDKPKQTRAKDEGMTVGWIVTHMVEEVARHCGHADLIRELIDGAVGE